MKAKCRKHFWWCVGTVGATHKGQRVLQGTACESNAKRDGRVVKCGRKETRYVRALIILTQVLTICHSEEGVDGQ